MKPIEVDTLKGLYDSFIHDEDKRWFRSFRCKHKKLTDPIVYSVGTKYCKSEAGISICEKCGKRLVTSFCRSYSSTPEAQNLIDNVIEKLGVPPRNIDTYGSYFFAEFPADVAVILDSQGEELARKYIEMKLKFPGN